MAGEWIPIDCNLADKPEVLELMDETGEPIEVVVYRLLRLWSWAALNTADGTLRATPARLKHVAGGDEGFWLAVERVGWIKFADGCVSIEGWDKRFSQAAKARAQANKRQDSYRKRKGDAPASRTSDAAPSRCGDATESPQERRGEEIRRQITLSPSSNGATTKGTDDGDDDLRILEGKPRQAGWAINAWQEFLGGPWKAAGKRAAVPNPQTQMRPPEGWVELADDAFQLAELERAAGMLSECRYFEEPVGVVHFLRIWRKILDGESYRKPRVSRVPGGQPERAPLKAFTGADADRFEATRRRLAEGSK